MFSEASEMGEQRDRRDSPGRLALIVLAVTVVLIFMFVIGPGNLGVRPLTWEQ